MPTRGRSLANGEFFGNFIPDADSSLDLGSTTKKWKSLYLSGSTLFLGDSGSISAGAGGAIAMPSMKIGTGANAVTLEASASGKLETKSTVDGVEQAAVPAVESIEQLTNVDLTIDAETATFGVDFPNAGHGADWLWSWTSGSIAYARATINQVTQSSVPLYMGGTYTVNNFAAHTIHGSMTQVHKIYLKWLKGAGTQNNVSWAVSTLNVTGVTMEGINGGNATTVQRNIINVPTSITLPSLVAPSVSYDVSFANAGAYTFSGSASGDNINIGPLYKGGTYTFNLDASLSGHPFYLTTDDGTSYVSGSYVGEYTTGVTGSRNESGTLSITVAADAPATLYYQCGLYSAMRGTISILPLAVATNADGNYLVYFQHTQEGHFTEVELKPKPALPSQVCLVYNTSTNKFSPQDMGEYIESTPVFKERVKDAAGEKITEKVGDGTLTSLAAVKTNTTYSANVSQQGDLQIHTGTARWYSPMAMTVIDVVPKLRVAADADITMTVKKNGNTVSNIVIVSGQTTVVLTGSNKSWAMADGDYLTLDISTVGTTDKGKDLVVQFKYQQT